MRRLAIYLVYIATALRGTLMIAARRDPTLTVILLAAYGLLLFGEPWLGRRLPARPYRAAYLLLQSGLVVAILVAPRTPDAFLALFFPLSFLAVEFFGWHLGRWWIAAFLAPMLLYAALHPEINNLIMAFAFEGGCFLLGAMAHLAQREEAARAKNLRLAGELRQAQKELEKYAGQVEELAAERARTLLARELHDSVTQTVFSLNLAVQAARLTLPKGPEAAAAQLGRVQSLSRGALAEISRLVSELQPAEGRGEDLVGGVRRLLSRYRGGDELEVDLHVDGGRVLSPAAAASLCDIVQESLANVQKHAGACRASIRIDLASRPAWLEVQDNGRGFDLESALDRPGHLGLLEMAERAREVGWRVLIDSEPGRGTIVRVEEMPEAAA
jgi:signal transduction histidine kinase